MYGKAEKTAKLLKRQGSLIRDGINDKVNVQKQIADMNKEHETGDAGFRVEAGAQMQAEGAQITGLDFDLALELQDEEEKKGQ